jgi:hypothetical protein
MKKLLFVFLIGAVFMMASTSAVYSGTQNIGDIVKGSTIQIRLNGVDDYAYAFLDGNNLVSSPNCAEQLPKYPITNCPAICVGSIYVGCSPQSKWINIDTSSLSIGAHRVVVLMAQWHGGGCYINSQIMVDGVQKGTFTSNQDGVLDCPNQPSTLSVNSMDSKRFNFNIIPDCTSCGTKECGVVDGGCEGTCGACSTGTCSPSGFCVDVGTPFWTDLLGNGILNASIEDTVRMEVTGVNVSSFDTNFTVKRGSNVVWWNPLTWLNDGVSTSFTAEEYYTLSSAGDHKFTVDIQTLSISEESGPLDVSATADNDPLILGILSPSCGSNFTDGDSEIIINVSDNDDLVEGWLNINENFVENLTNGINNIVYDFEEGENTLLVEISNSRGEKARTISNVIVTNGTTTGKYVAACLDKPLHGSYFNKSRIDFLATSTRALDCVGGVCGIILPTDNSERFSFNWTFPGDTELNRHAMGNGNIGSSALPYNFTVNFRAAGNHRVILDVSFS